MGKVAIVIPCYNEEKRIDQRRFVKFLNANPEIIFVFVNDGSHDGTEAVLKDIVQSSPGSKFISLEKNSGKAEAVRQGINYAISLDQVEVMGYYDADMATPLYELKRMVSIFRGRNDLFLMASRVLLLGRSIQRRLARHIIGRVFATFASIILDLRVYDTQCGCKLFKKTPAIKTCFSEPFISRWLFDVEVIARLTSQLGYTEHDFVEEPLMQWTDITGSKIRGSAFFKAPYELLKIHLDMRKRLKAPRKFSN